MKVISRIEITALHQHVVIVRRERRHDVPGTGVEPTMSDVACGVNVEPASIEGREVLREAIRILTECMERNGL